MRVMVHVLMKHLADRGEYQICSVIAARFKDTNVWRPDHYHLLMRAYSRSADPDVATAFALLNEMKAVCQPQIMTHNSILHIYARKKMPKEAFEYRDKLIQEGILLDRATYNILLNIAVEVSNRKTDLLRTVFTHHYLERQLQRSTEHLQKDSRAKLHRSS